MSMPPTSSRPDPSSSSGPGPHRGPSRRTLLRMAAPVALLGACGQASDTPGSAGGGTAGGCAAGTGTAGAGTAGTSAGSTASGAVVGGTTAATSGTSTATTAAGQLPRGGRTLFPEHRLVGYCGVPGSRAMGRLGIGSLDERAQEIEKLATEYTGDGRTALPVLELIATVVQSRAGRDGLYRTRIRSSVIDEHLQAARRHRALLLINIQPGRATFPAEVAAYERWLREPDVGLALDPEWRMGPREVPMRVFGSVTGAELNEVGEQVSRIVAENGLPEKAVVVHQLSPRIIRDEASMREFPGVAWVKSIDGIGSATAKANTWNRIVPTTSPVWELGFKLFYEEDVEHGPLMTPQQVLALQPTPAYVMYE